MPKHDREWERIAEEAISQCESVKCSLREFAEGLHDVEIALRDRRELAESEADAAEAEDE